MVNFLEFIERSYSGRILEKSSWDLDEIAIPVREIVGKYDLTWDKAQICFPRDDDMPRRYFAAGRELLAESGVYNISTGRVIRLSREEIDEALMNQRQTLTMGQASDAFTLYARQPEDARKPAVFGGNPGCPTPDRLFYACVRGWAQEKAIDLLTCGSLVDVDGYQVRRGEASELLAVRRELVYLNQAAADAGRPGLGRLAAESAVSELGDVSAFAPGFIRPGDSHLVALMNELIINRDNLVRAAAATHTGVFNASLACVMVEGLAGGAPGAAVVMIASLMAANILCRADYHLCHPIHLRHIATSTRECMWLEGLVCRAFALCAPAIIVCDIYPKAGAMTKELLWETAANSLAITVSGGHLEGVGSANGLRPHGTGLEARLMGEVGRAASKSQISLEAANEMILSMLEKYEYIFNGNAENNYLGVPFDVAYDLASVNPKKEWLDMYYEVRKNLSELGLAL
ncbi:MAG: monomethylamine:corrinoid methyltransferase [Treponema sp.]|jgi:methylamine--corrinoid protein Co-methyltransferase|nr:monomethylamine:corrinoid methyltransferase [Treponema sp.]